MMPAANSQVKVEMDLGRIRRFSSIAQLNDKRFVANQIHAMVQHKHAFSE